jgi:hypothetical protein
MNTFTHENLPLVPPASGQSQSEAIDRETPLMDLDLPEDERASAKEILEQLGRIHYSPRQGSLDRILEYQNQDQPVSK